MKTLGFCTGFAYKTIPPTSRRAIEICRRIGCRAIELSCIGGFGDSSLSGLKKLKASDLADFRYISLHAPSRNVKYRRDDATRQILDIMQKACAELNAQCVVIHPDTVIDWGILKEYPLPFAFENMDNRKKSHRDVGDMLKVFQDTDYEFVLDVNHCFANDPTMRLAEEMLKNFGDRLCEIHVSGYTNYHAPLHRTEQKEILEAIPDTDVPMIIESCCSDEHEAKKEYEYIKQYFNTERGRKS